MSSCLQPLVETLSHAIGTCGRRNLRIILDATATTCDVIGGRVMHQQPAAVQQLLVPLLNRWQQVGFMERDVVPIMEALTNIAVALGPAFEAYAPAVFDQCVKLLAVQLEAQKAKVSSRLRVPVWLNASLLCLRYRVDAASVVIPGCCCACRYFVHTGAICML